MLIYTAYLDESGTHDGSPVTVMGGVMANAAQWRRFEAEFDRIKKRHGFRIFHTTKFKARRGDFTGWTDERRMALLLDMAHLTNDAFTEGVAMKLDNKSYESDYRSGENPRKLRLDSKYGLCFRQCLLLFVLEAEKRIHRGEWPKLHIVVESGASNSGAAATIFDEMKRELEAGGCNLLQSIVFADKDKCDPLMVADFIAHTTYATHQKGLSSDIQRKATTPAPGQSGITHLEFKPGGLVNIRSALLERLHKRRR